MDFIVYCATLSDQGQVLTVETTCQQKPSLLSALDMYKIKMHKEKFLENFTIS